MWTEEPKVEWTQTGPWKFLNYAILHAGGIPHVLDMMRYEPAFFVRLSDVELMLESANDKMEFVRRRFAILLCKPDERGITRPGWWPQRLLSDQEYEEVAEQRKLFDLTGSGKVVDALLDFHSRPPLKWRGEVEITGTLSEVLLAMYENKAFPADEKYSHVIESGFYKPGEKMSVKIASFRNSDQSKFIKLPKAVST